MKFDAHKGDRGEVYDANGKPLLCPIRGDTLTGLVECYVVGPKGFPQYDEDGNAKTHTVRYAAPLQIKNAKLGRPFCDLLLLESMRKLSQQQPACIQKRKKRCRLLRCGL